MALFLPVTRSQGRNIHLVIPNRLLVYIWKIGQLQYHIPSIFITAWPRSAKVYLQIAPVEEVVKAMWGLGVSWLPLRTNKLAQWRDEYHEFRDQMQAIYIGRRSTCVGDFWLAQGTARRIKSNRNPFSVNLKQSSTWASPTLQTHSPALQTPKHKYQLLGNFIHALAWWAHSDNWSRSYSPVSVQESLQLRATTPFVRY